MGQVRSTITVTNLLDPAKRVSAEAIVDTGATLLGLPRRMVEEFGLTYSREVKARTTNGTVTRRVYKAAEISIGDRSATVEILELDDDFPPLVGVVPLEAMDLVIDPRNETLGPNIADHGGEYMVDLL